MGLLIPFQSVEEYQPGVIRIVSEQADGHTSKTHYIGGANEEQHLQLLNKLTHLVVDKRLQQSGVLTESGIEVLKERLISLKDSDKVMTM